MASYFVAYHASPFGEVAVHDRVRCPPGCFLREGTTEYLGEFLEAAQAVAVARLRYAHARGCPECEPARAPAPLLPLAMPTAPA